MALPLVASFLLLLLANTVHAEDSISFSVTSFSSEPAALTYQGDTHVPSGYSYLRLTKTDKTETIPQTLSVGRVLFSTPVQLWRKAPARQASFDTTIKFQITPSGKGAADGIAFFIAPFGTIPPRGSAGENLGIFDSSGTSPSLFAVEFDTFINSAVDPGFRHIGVDVNSKNSRSTARVSDSLIGPEVTARITYEARTKRLTVVVGTDAVSYTHHDILDLKTFLPQQVQVGISSSTGKFEDGLGIHDILAWSFTSTMV